MLQDLRFALRQLIKSPGFTLIAVVTLGLGIGANTSMFSVLNTLMLKPLPYADSASLSSIYRATAQNPEGGVSPADFLDLQREAGALRRDRRLHARRPPRCRSRDDRRRWLPASASPPISFRRSASRRNSAATSGAAKTCTATTASSSSVNVAGRTASAAAPTSSAAPFASTASRTKSSACCRPRSTTGGTSARSISSGRLASTKEQLADRRATTLRLIGRRSATLSRAEADGFIANFGARLATDFPEVNAGSTWRTVSLNDTVIGRTGATMVSMLVGLSGFVLLIACSNLANLLLARTMARAREFAVRSALGASRMQLLRPLIAESLLLALAGGVCAIFVAQWVADWLAVRSTGDNGEQVVFALDWHVLGWAFVASLVTAVAFGLAPALFALRLNVNDTLKSGARGMTGGRGHQRFRHALIVGQFALAMVLLAGAALFIRGLDNLNKRRSGWESEQLVGGTVLLPAAGYPDADRITAFHRLALARLQSLPGVASASISSFTPFFNWADIRKYLVEGRELPQPGHEPAAVVNSISPRYFDTFGTRVLAGRAFNERDTLTSPKVFIISQAMAKGLFANENPIGRRLATAGGGTRQWGEIVGVVADVKSVLPDAVRVTYQLYQPMAQEPRALSEIAVRAAGVAPATLVAGIRAVMTNLDPDLPVRGLQPADATIYRANYQLGVFRDMLSAFAVLGLGLAALGIYGVIARTMTQRTGEFAIRLALGASVSNITRMVLGSGVKLALVGSAIGLLGALGVSRLLGAAWPGMQFDNAPVMAGATAFLIAIALIACYLPARHASRISAVEALRSDE